MTKKFSVQINKKIKKFNHKISVECPDKSITHRALFLSSQCMGISEFNGLSSEDILATVAGLKKLGVKILKKGKKYKVFGNGIGAFKKYAGSINCGNSGSSARFFLGLASTYPFPITIRGDKSLEKRPMKRVSKYLENIGAKIYFKNKKNTLPANICGTNWPLAQKHEITEPSAQIKTAIILSALNTPGITEIIEKHDTRDHTERLLKTLGGDIKIKKIRNKKIIIIKGHQEMSSFKMNVPSDPSSASFFVVQTLLSKDSSILIKDVCINKTRIGFIEILKKMNGKIKFLNRRKIFGEDVADLFVKSSKLKKIKCNSKIVPRVIDELPLMFATCALGTKGQSMFTNLLELRYKEEDRIKLMQKGLRKFGIKTYSTKDSLRIFGKTKFNLKKKIVIDPGNDHRIAMCFYIIAQLLGGNILIKNFNTVNSSFPNFLKIQKKIGAKHEIK